MFALRIVLAVGALCVWSGCSEENPSDAGGDEVEFYADTRVYPPSATVNNVLYSMAISVDTALVGQAVALFYNINNTSSERLDLRFTTFAQFQVTVRAHDGTMVKRHPDTDSLISPITVHVNPSTSWGPYILLSLAGPDNVPFPAGTYTIRARLNAAPAPPILMKTLVIQ